MPRVRTRVAIHRLKAFTLVELLVVLGVITILVSLLLPALARVRQQALQVRCQSNLRQVGAHLLVYVNQSRGWLFPVGPPAPTGLPTTLGTNVPHEQRWPVYVFTPAVWNPPILKCPSDVDPVEEHSYVLNQHLADHRVRYSTTHVGGLTSSEIVVMGEKFSTVADYYMERGDFFRVVDPYRHGVHYGSNYLYLDMHVSTTPPDEARAGTDPWDPPTDQGP
jgi:prepilin-type N-terminal cleavage/methylation domain-containing protein